MIDHTHMKELISADFDGQTTAEEKELLGKHLAECVECRDYVRQLQKLSATLDQWDNEDLSPDLEAKIQRGLKEVIMQREKAAVHKHPLFKVGVGGGTLVAILVLLLSTQLYMQRGLQGRLKTASDDIGRQFVPSRTYTDTLWKPAMQDRARDAGQYLESQTSTLGSMVQYEPYYLSSEYTVSKNEGKVRSMGGYQSSTYADKGFAPMAGRADISAQMQSPSTAATMDMRKSQEYTRHFDENIAYGITGDHADSQVLQEGASLYHYGMYHPEYEYDYKRIHRPDTEEYAPVYESSFLEAQYNPLSTFSIDVDTTSYSNIRRFLNSGQLPPADAVRVEEMINYFGYDYPEPGWGKPFSVTTNASYCPWNPQHYLVQVGIKGKTPKATKVPPSNLVFLIDVSGSMNQSNKLPLLKESFRMFVDQLSGNERVAIVTYSGSASLVLDSTPGSDKWRILQAIDNLSAGGSTAGAAGIHLAYDIAQRNFIKGGNNRVILATDGDFNVGVSSNDELVRLIEAKRDYGIFLSILGFGTGNYKDAKMEGIADKGNGNYFYIDSLNEGRKVLVEELGSTLFTIAKDVKIQVEFNPATVKAYKLIGYENRAMANQDFNDDTKDAGELGAGHTVTAFYEVVPATATTYTPPGVDPLKYQRTPNMIFVNNDLMTVKLRYKEPGSDDSQLIKHVVRERDVTNTPADDFQFASAVAEFGLLLRGSPYRANASYDHVLMRARRYMGADKHGHKSEFIGLVEKARSLDHRSVPAPAPYPYQYPYPEYNGSQESNINFKGE